MRVILLKNYAKEHFPATPLLDYALEVEKITVSKVRSLFDDKLSIDVDCNKGLTLKNSIVRIKKKKNTNKLFLLGCWFFFFQLSIYNRSDCCL